MGKLQRKIETIFWGEPPEDPKERKLLVKLDMVILSYVCLSYWVNYLDRTNLSNAYVTGMKEDVGFKGNDLTLVNSCFTAGYIVGQWPSAVILASGRIPPRVWFPFCVFAWGICTLGLAFVTHPGQVMGVRFVMAIFEASTFSGSHYILGCWYKDKEIGKRTAGSFFSGVMQGGIQNSMNGTHGLAGWKWLFIIDFIITVPIAIYGYIMFPDTPHTTKAFWMTEEERQLCLRRLPPTEHYVITWARFKSSIWKTVTTWRFYLFSALFMVSATAFEKVGIYSECLLWLKSIGWSPVSLNYLGLLPIASAIVFTYVITVYCDATGHRFIANVIMYVSVLISAIMLLVWDISNGAKFFAYTVAGIGYAGQASNFAWANVLTREDEMLRSMTLFSMNLFSNLWALWYGIAIWPVSHAPKFRNGQIATIVTGAASIVIAYAIVYCSKRWPPPALQETDEVENAEKGFGDVAQDDHSVDDKGPVVA